MLLLVCILLPLMALLIFGVHTSRYGGSTASAMMMFLAGCVVISLWIWGAMTYLHPAPYWRQASPYIRPGWDQPQ